MNAIFLIYETPKNTERENGAPSVKGSEIGRHPYKFLGVAIGRFFMTAAGPD